MKINYEIARKYWMLAAQEDVTLKFEKDGYTVEREPHLGKFTPDLVARRENEVVVVEFKMGVWDRKRAQSIQKLRNYAVHRLGAKFHLIWLAPPRDKEIEVENLEEELTESLSNDLPDELDSLSSHTRIEGVADISISSICLEKKQTIVTGEGAVEVELVYGSSSDAEKGDDGKMIDSYPFEFEIVLNLRLEIIEVNYIKVDTSSFYK